MDRRRPADAISWMGVLSRIPRRPASSSTPLALAGGCVFAVVMASELFLGKNDASVAVWRFLLIGIALYAFAGGSRGGLGAGLAAVVITAIWYAAEPAKGDTDVLVAVRSLNYVVAGAIIGLLVDARTRTLSANVDLQRNLSTVVESALDGLVQVDANGTVVVFNRAAEGIFGYGRDEVIGRDVGMLMADPFHAEPDGNLAYREAEESGQTTLTGGSRETTGRRKDGTVFPLDIAVSETTVDGGTVFVGVVRDITERKQAEERERHYRQTLEWAVRDRTRELQEQTAALEEARLETLQRLAMAGEYHDEDTYLHTERVGASAARIALTFGSTREWVELIRLAAPLHDLGKLALSDEILLKQGQLSEQEWESVRGHPLVGAAILAGSTSKVLQLAEEIALNHHEWWDGSGYPFGLAGTDIPLSGRIVTLADTFDALTHDRPYKPAWPVADAVAEIERLSGSKFDPAVVDAFRLLDPHELAADPATQVLPRVAPRLRMLHPPQRRRSSAA
jgi:PAS domain S-box-containing protein